MYKERQARIQQYILEAAVQIAPRVGWGAHMLQEASSMAGYPVHMAELVFIDGAVGMLMMLHQQLDGQMLAALAELDPQPHKISERIFNALAARFKVGEKYKEALVCGMSFLALPHNASYGTRMLWQTVDTMWYYAGSHDASFAYYTKRATLATVYGASAVYWATDDSPGARDTMEFIKRRLDDVVTMGRFIKKIKGQE